MWVGGTAIFRAEQHAMLPNAGRLKQLLKSRSLLWRAKRAEVGGGTGQILRIMLFKERCAEVELPKNLRRRASCVVRGPRQAMCRQSVESQQNHNPGPQSIAYAGTRR